MLKKRIRNVGYECIEDHSCNIIITDDQEPLYFSCLWMCLQQDRTTVKLVRCVYTEKM